MPFKKVILLLAVVLSSFGGLVYGGWELYMRRVESPAYDVLSEIEGAQIRLYHQRIVAQAIVTGDQHVALTKGFRILANYIFGENAQNLEIAMTKPVMQQFISSKKEKSFSGDDKEWKVMFYMPTSLTLKQLPAPTNPIVSFQILPARKFVVIRFSGKPTEVIINEYQNKLQEIVRKQQLTTVGESWVAFYNPPWTASFLRRNEVMFEIAT